MESAVERTFPAAPEVPARARQLVRHLELDPETHATVELIVSELVTNAVLHGGGARSGELSVALERQGNSIRGEVCDDGEGFQWEPHEPDLDEPGGLGLLVVDKVAERWGVHQNAVSCVWFECPDCAAGQG
ncbi:MAG: ATP-binding protein [Actinomycetota bacterium]|nr:ATP-binding protein [Actinomycetota bacterium]